eukprot:scaffold2902_cov333-Pinguiococcus_pyrenoidosus.AAC.1
MLSVPDGDLVDLFVIVCETEDHLASAAARFVLLTQATEALLYSRMTLSVMSGSASRTTTDTQSATSPLGLPCTGWGPHLAKRPKRSLRDSPSVSRAHERVQLRPPLCLRKAGGASDDGLDGGVAVVVADVAGILRNRRAEEKQHQQAQRSARDAHPRRGAAPPPSRAPACNFGRKRRSDFEAVRRFDSGWRRARPILQRMHHCLE